MNDYPDAKLEDRNKFLPYHPVPRGDGDDPSPGQYMTVDEMDAFIAFLTKRAKAGLEEKAETWTMVETDTAMSGHDEERTSGNGVS